MEETPSREDYIPSDIHKIHSLVLKQGKVIDRPQEHKWSRQMGRTS
jgi:hypothetical protein